MLDFTTCTECGRCQSQCPAWNTEKPLSPKLLITAMRDHAYAKAPYVQAGGEGSETATALLEKDEVLAREAARPLVGDTGDEWFYMPEDGTAVIDSDVLWNCTSCGACVQQCPVDIEHVDHIMDMRRYQVLVEANFPAELNQLFKGLENKGNPWNMSSSARMDWAKGLDFDVPVVGEDLESLESVDWLFWVGCAGAYEDRAKKTTRAVAELLDMAGISFGVLGNGETCTGDPARRAGNEFVFQGLAQQNVETFKEYKVKKVVSTCAHCFNTLKNEYKDFGIELEVVHHTQLLNRLVREGKLTPIKDGAGAAKRSITYHDPCYLGRHNQVYSPPRELLQILPGAEFTEMERNSEKSFCCGAGGARMWMEENIGERINVNRTKEAVGTGADQIAVGCPFCRVMLSDGLTAEQAKGNAREEVEILDVAQMLLASVKGESATKAGPGSSAAPPPLRRPLPAPRPALRPLPPRATPTSPPRPSPRPATSPSPRRPSPRPPTSARPPRRRAARRSSTSTARPSPTPTVRSTETPSDATRASGTPKESGSLFDLGGDEETPAPAAREPAAAARRAARPEAAAEDARRESPQAGSPPSRTSAPAARSSTCRAAEPARGRRPAPAAPPTPAAPAARRAGRRGRGLRAAATTPRAPTTDLGSSGSLFDIAAEPADATHAAARPTAAPATESSDAPQRSHDVRRGRQPGDRRRRTSRRRPAPASTPATSIPEGGSLFDIEAPTPVAAPAGPAPRRRPRPPAAGAEASEPDVRRGGCPGDRVVGRPRGRARRRPTSGCPATDASDVPRRRARSAPRPPRSRRAARSSTSRRPPRWRRRPPAAAPGGSGRGARRAEPRRPTRRLLRRPTTSDVPEPRSSRRSSEGLAGGAALSQAATFAAAEDEPTAQARRRGVRPSRAEPEPEATHRRAAEPGRRRGRAAQAEPREGEEPGARVRTGPPTPRRRTWTSTRRDRSSTSETLGTTPERGRPVTGGGVRRRCSSGTPHGTVDARRTLRATV